MRHIFVLGIVLTVALLLTTPAQAATFDVDTTLDSADPAYQACTAAPDDCSLRGAILAANATAGPDSINVPAGVYQLTIVGSDDNALTGDLDITDDLTLTGVAGTTTVDASLLTNGDRSFHITGGGAITVEIHNMTITGGESIPGAGVQVDTGTLNLHNCTVEDNDAMSNSGGGIYNTATTNLYNTIVQNNHVVHDGGGIYNADNATLFVVDSTVQNNISDRYGGGIYTRGTYARVLRSTVTGNTAAQSGGGIMTWGDLDVAVSIISLNAANGSAGVPEGGGGINAYSIGNTINVRVIDSTIIDNDALPGYGGGVITFENVALTIRNSTVTDNQALYGGGLYAYGDIEMTNSTVSNNTATADGGGIWAGGGGSLTVGKTTVKNNTAVQGAGLWVADMTTTVRNATVFRDNTASGYGGAIYYLNAGAAPTPLTMTNVLLLKNHAARGGGLYAFGGTAWLLNVAINGNSATQQGGGINATDMEPMVIAKSTISNNTSDGNGGGLYNAMWGTSSIISFSSSTISGNTAVGSGGGVANIFSPVGAGLVAQVHLFNVTVADNDGAGVSDGLYTDGGLVQARNSIVGQQVTAGADCLAVGGGVINGIGPNLEEGVSCGFTLNGVAPGLDPLALNAPGTTPTHALQAISPAINAGPAGGCFGDMNGDGLPDVLLANDQRGVARVGVCDLGAYEF